jgi:thiol-disulfide isomerase/thioredoxin
VPTRELATLGSARASLAALAGQPVLLNLWATWCLPCLAEMPELAALEQRFGQRGLTLVGVSVDNAAAEGRVRALAASRDLPFTVWLDPDMRLYGELFVQALPTSFVIGRDGRILWRKEGALSARDPALLEALERALAGGDNTALR